MLPRQSNEPIGIENQVRSNDQGQNPPPAPENWQQMLGDMQARLQRQGEEIRQLRQQHVPAGNAASEAPSAAPVPVVQQQTELENRWELLYEQFRKQDPPAVLAQHHSIVRARARARARNEELKAKLHSTQVALSATQAALVAAQQGELSTKAAVTAAQEGEQATKAALTAAQEGKQAAKVSLAFV
ncbi:uncharacterized protein LOC133792012 [Humulus lupulus]|uniref:uncharacterized protein LOC133792012 n=1 Tax=Humulus lupulus TaxID=3486 RepID=UPI002B4171C4|nr:uncharacterized protein LOC133792012 [Humulus lupulus]